MKWDGTPAEYYEFLEKHRQRRHSATSYRTPAPDCTLCGDTGYLSTKVSDAAPPPLGEQRRIPAPIRGCSLPCTCLPTRTPGLVAHHEWFVVPIVDHRDLQACSYGERWQVGSTRGTVVAVLSTHGAGVVPYMPTHVVLEALGESPKKQWWYSYTGSKGYVYALDAGAHSVRRLPAVARQRRQQHLVRHERKYTWAVAALVFSLVLTPWLGWWHPIAVGSVCAVGLMVAFALGALHDRG